MQTTPPPARPTAPALRRPLALAVSGRYVAIALQLAASLVVARLLTPTDFGVFGIAASLVAVVASLREFGVTNYLIQQRDIDRATLGRGLALTGAMSLALGLPLFLARHALAAWFGVPELAGPLGLLCLNFLLVPPSIGPMAMLYRDMRLGAVQAVNLVALAAGGGISILLAARGHGPSSLALGQVAQSAVLLALLLAVDPRAVLVRPVLAGFAPMLRFGLFSTLGYIVFQAGGYGASLILGRTAGPHAVGQYERGNGLVQSIGNDLVGAIVQVVYLGLTRLRDDPPALAALFRRALANLAAALFPGYALLAVLAGPVVLVLFGPQWAPAVPPLRILALGGMLATGYALQARLLVAFGETARVFRVELLGQPLRLLMILALAPFGLEAASCGSVLGSLVLLLLYLRAARRFVRLAPRDLLAAYAGAVGVACVTAAGPAVLLALGGDALPPVALLLAGGAMGLLSWVAALFALRHGLAGELRLLARRFSPAGGRPRAGPA